MRPWTQTSGWSWLVAALLAAPIVGRHPLVIAQDAVTVSPIVAVNPIWNQWRGPTRDGRLAEDRWPADLKDGTLTQLWRVPLGPSYSGPLVVGDIVVVTETESEKFEVVKALDRKSGDVRWQARWEGSISVPFFAKENGDWIRATPAVADGKLYVAGMRDVLVCLNLADGSEVFRVDFAQKFGAPLPGFGLVCSPLVDGDALYIQAGASVIRLNAQSGDVVWRSLQDEGGMWGSAFSSPVLADLAGRRQLVVQTRSSLAGLDPETGTVLWSKEIPAFRGMNILTPCVAGDTIFTSSYGGKSLLLRVTPQENGFNVEEVWAHTAQGYMSTPVVIDGHVYMHLRNQRFTCLDLVNGEEKWTSEPFGKYWSLIHNDKQILALDQRGGLVLVAANPDKFQLLDKRRLTEEETWAHLAKSGDELFIRELGAISAYRWASPGNETPAVANP